MFGICSKLYRDRNLFSNARRNADSTDRSIEVPPFYITGVVLLKYMPGIFSFQEKQTILPPEQTKNAIFFKIRLDKSSFPGYFI
jgi:hypothetical protein